MDLDRKVTVENRDILAAVACSDAERNVADLSVSLFKALLGDLTAFSTLRLRPSTPDEKMAAEIQKEQTTINDIEQWLSV
jgi:hypothetical protein